jgi:hypothetical protein
MNNLKDATKIFVHNLKQSTFLISGNTSLYTSLSIKKHTQLVDSIIDGTLYPTLHCVVY